MNIELTTKLLEDFKKIPIKFKDSTYLELCQYPKRRFEEICSRLLAFYFDPSKEHEMGDLFISSLLNILNKKFVLSFDDIEIITEDNADGKRIDLVILAPEFVIGIENKITASLYNPLKTYGKKLDGYKRKETIKRVLSVFEIQKPSEKDLMKETGFDDITYHQLFEEVKKSLPDYQANCNPKYLNHLLDFIDTIENMKTSGYKNQAMADFFLQNDKQLDKIVAAYNNFKKEVRNLQKDEIKELSETISEKTGAKWWIYQDFDLGIDKRNTEDYRVGIESNFDATSKNATDVFKIYITTWSRKDFDYYKKHFENEFPGKVNKPIRDSNKYMIEVATLPGDDYDSIISKLKEAYNFIVEITKVEEVETA